MHNNLLTTTPTAFRLLDNGVFSLDHGVFSVPSFSYNHRRIGGWSVSMRCKLSFAPDARRDTPLLLLGVHSRRLPHGGVLFNFDSNDQIPI